MEHSDECIEPSAPEQLDEFVPLARPVGEARPTPPALPQNPSNEFLLLNQSRPDVIVDCVLFIVLFLALSLPGEIALATIYENFLAPAFASEEERESAVSKAILFPAIGWRALVCTALAAWMAKRRGTSLRSVGLSLKSFWGNLGLGLATFLAIMLATGFFTLLIQAFYPKLFEGFEKNADMIIEAIPKASLPILALVCLFIGYYEELAFRGFLMPRMRRATGSWVVAVLGNTAIFVPLHLMDQAAAALPAVAGLSLTFSLVTVWRKSLVPAIVAHAMFDYIMFVNLYFSAGDKWK